MAEQVFCPFCNANQPADMYREGGRTMVRCQSCGLPVGDASAAKAAAPTKKPRILCIDDDRLLLALFTDTLEGHDFEALTASDGPSGIETARKERPDVILLDVMMPKMSGFEVCRRMRADPAFKGTPIIILTAMEDPRLKEKGMQAGANLAMRKPFDPAQLITIIKKALALKAKPRAT